MGPASSDPATIAAMLDAGVDVFRISASHDPVEVVCERIRTVQNLAAANGAVAATMVDLCGPKLRCEPPTSSTTVIAGSVWTIHSGPAGADSRDLGSSVPAGVFDALPAGTLLAVGDGALQFEVLDTANGSARCRALANGILRGRPGLHVPAEFVTLATPTEEDLEVLAAAVATDVDAVAVSFVRTAADIRVVQVAAPDQLVVAKIETVAAVERLDEILAAADAVMVARGDLGLEFPLAEVPFLQRRIIHAATAAARPVITATQMLESMVSSAVPTRAEAADVATAVLDGTSAVMLSGETAVGADPVTAVATMATLAARADQEVVPRTQLPLPKTGDSSTALTTHAVSEATHAIASATGSVAVVGLTDSGFTARALARWRSPLPLVAATRSARVVRQLRFAWGVHAVEVASNDVDSVLDELVAAGVLPPDAPVVVVSGVPGARASDTVAVRFTPPHR